MQPQLFAIAITDLFDNVTKIYFERGVDAVSAFFALTVSHKELNLAAWELPPDSTMDSLEEAFFNGDHILAVTAVPNSSLVPSVEMVSSDGEDLVDINVTFKGTKSLKDAISTGTVPVSMGCMVPYDDKISK